MGLALRIQDLSWSFSPNLDPFLVIPALEIAAGENVALSGPSGCGKSSLLFLLAGMELPQKGSLIWGDGDMMENAYCRSNNNRKCSAIQ